MKAVWNGKVVAEAGKEDLIYIERNWYFPPSSVQQDLLRKSNTPYNCPWKGNCQFFDVGASDNWSADSAFCYPAPKKSAIDTVKKDFAHYVCFWRDVTVEE
ncbi:MAG: DUF427 domain-containing protein [Candidatus Saccharimonadales bacterium]